MNARDRQLAAIRHQVSDRVSVDAIAIEPQAEIAGYLQIDRSSLLRRLGTDGRVLYAPYLGEPGKGSDKAVELMQRPECVYLAPFLDYTPQPVSEIAPLMGMSPATEWGTPNTGDYGTNRPYPLAGTTSLREIERYPWPDPARYDYAWAGQMARGFAEDYAIRGPYWKPLFCQVCDMVGLEEALVQMVTDPLRFEAILEQVFLHTVEYCRRFIDACGNGLHILYLGDDFATQRGMMISPALWRRFLKPRYMPGCLNWANRRGNMSGSTPAATSRLCFLTSSTSGWMYGKRCSCILCP